ncbi:hypothetical protein BKP66_05645 [Bacillus amyloliquefaciens]|uniref:Uncharacterized protein n=1 Tax=Bacillus amyloliquefaciens TaxID=1390 RepID=A0AAP7N6H0_BACAM|nr:hypothetical protein BKP66_05645 [Bacillus amyloliquefaciens]
MSIEEIILFVFIAVIVSLLFLDRFSQKKSRHKVHSYSKSYAVLVLFLNSLVIKVTKEEETRLTKIRFTIVTACIPSLFNCKLNKRRIISDEKI